MKRDYTLILLSIIILCHSVLCHSALCHSALAQSGPILPERPGFGDSTTLVPDDVIQLETGYTFTHESSPSDDFSGHTFPDLLVRNRLTSQFELRLGWRGNQWSDPGDDGALDLSAGFKTVLVASEKFRVAHILDIVIPTGSSENNERDVTPDARFVFGYDLDDTYSLGSNINLLLPRTEDGHELQGATSLALNRALSDRVSSFIEYFVQYQGDSPAHSADTGLSYLVTDLIQLDLTLGIGINDRADDFFTSVGFSIRN